MSNKCGMPWMKLDSKSHSTSDSHHGNNKAVMGEAHEERWSSDPDLDRSLTSQNLYYGYRSGMELYNDINKEIEALSEQLRNEGKRGVRKDAITSFAGIVKPDKELMENLTKEQQVKFFEDAMEILNEKFGSHNGKNNIRSFVIQFDEGNPHMHYFGVPYTADGRLSAKEIFTPKLSRWLNEEFPKQMNNRGWNLEPCRDENSYDPEVAKTLNEQELKEYKNKCLEHKKNKQKQHGRSAKAHKEEQDRKDGFETGFDAVYDEINHIANTIANQRINLFFNTFKEVLDEAHNYRDEYSNLSLNLGKAIRKAKGIVDMLETDLVYFRKDIEKFKEKEKATSMADYMEEHIQLVEKQIKDLEALVDSDEISDEEEQRLQKLYDEKKQLAVKNFISQGQQKLKPSKQYSDNVLIKIQKELERQEKQPNNDIGPSF